MIQNVDFFYIILQLNQFLMTLLNFQFTGFFKLYIFMLYNYVYQIKQICENMGCVKSTIIQTGNQIKNVANNQDPEFNKQVKGARGVLRLKVSEDQDFLTHHIQNQYFLSQYASADKIRRRQVLEYLKLVYLEGKYFNSNFRIHLPLIQKSWMQRNFMEIMEDAQKQFFQLNKTYDQVRRKIADRYLFQLYQYKEFLDAGYGTIIFKNKYQDNHPRQKLGWIVSQSDAALFAMLKQLKNRFPQVADSSKIEFPEVKELKIQVDLFQNFNSLCYSDPQYLNFNTIFYDLKFLIDTSIREYKDFSSDLKDILGSDALTDSKVKYVQKDGKQIFSASPVRRIFIKWVQTLMQRYGNQIQKYNIMEFIKSKFAISQNFNIKSVEGSQTTHNSILLILAELLQQIKFSNPNQRNPKFGFYIYDLVRCKTHRGTGQQVVNLLQKMQSTKITKSGKKFEVVRIKNRFKTPNRDLMVNFRYGDILVGEAQLCIDSSDVSQKTKKTNKFNHYLYELERGLFGPTIELMMQYQDFYRSDVEVEMFTGLIKKRSFQLQPQSTCSISTRKCVNNHQMYQIEGMNFPFKVHVPSNNPYYECDFCNNLFYPNVKYDYCFRCGLIYCNKCILQYKSYNFKAYNLSILNKTNETIFTKQEQLIAQIKRQRVALVLFYNPQNASSIIEKEFLTYLGVLNSVFKTMTYEKVIMMPTSEESVKQMCRRLKIMKFPALCVINSNFKISKCLIGCSLQYVTQMFQVKAKIQKGSDASIVLYCINHEQKRMLQLNNLPRLQNCSFCQVQKNRLEKNYEILEKKNFFTLDNLDTRNTECKPCNRHFCKQCSAFSYQDVINVEDTLGTSYLSHIQRYPSRYNCKNNHKLKYVTNNNVTDVILNCNACRKQFYYNSQLGYSYCQICPGYLYCPPCLGIQIQQISQSKRNKQLAIHLVEATASEGTKCVGCDQYFKKVYIARSKQKQHFHIVEQESMYRWRCKGPCYAGFENKVAGIAVQLHLACFKCDIQICMKCTAALRILQPKRLLDNKYESAETKYVCSNNHKIVKINKVKNQFQLSFPCSSCKSMFYTHTPHFFCESCDINWCMSCGTRKLTYQGESLVCSSQHPLSKLDDTSRLLIGFRCQNCEKVVQKGNLNPVLTCNQCSYYFVCFECRIQMTKETLTNKNQLAVKCILDHFMTKRFDYKGALAFCSNCLAGIQPPYFGCGTCPILYCSKCAINEQS